MNKQADFKFLSLEDKVDRLSAEGVYLSCRQNSMHHIFLYGIAGLYVEVTYLKDSNRLVTIYVVTTDSVVSNYLQDLNLEEL